MEEDGHKIIKDKLEQFIDKESVLNEILRIIKSCLFTIPENLVAFHWAETGISTHLITIIKQGKYENSVEIALEILDQLCGFDLTHGKLKEAKILQFLKEKFDFFIRKDSATLKAQEMIQIAHIFKIVSSLARNPDMCQYLQENQTINNLVKIYTVNQSQNYFRELMVESLIAIVENEYLIEEIRNTNLNLKRLTFDCLESRNMHMIQKAEQVCSKIASEEQIQNIIHNIKNQNHQEEEVIFLSFLDSQVNFSGFLNDEELAQKLIKSYNEPNQSENLKLSVVKIMTQLINFNQDIIEVFNASKGIDQIINTIEDPTDDSFMFLVESLRFFTKVIEVSGDSFMKSLLENNIPKKLVIYFNNLQKKFKNFLRYALTIEKAFDSLEYHQGETSRKILMTMKKVNIKDLVDKNLALYYISCESLCSKLFNFFSSVLLINPKFSKEFDKKFFETGHQLMRVFKNSKNVYDNMYKLLGEFKYDKSQGKYLIDLDYMSYLCDKIWIKPKWKIFNLHCLRFIEKLTDNNEILRQLNQGVWAVKLVASIKNFINEEDYKSFDVHEEDDKDHISDRLNYDQEREIQKKSIRIMSKLMDTTILQSFQNKITKSINNFKARQETVLILRSEYAVLTCANGINTFGCEGLKSDLQDWMAENIVKIEKKTKNKYFRDKEKLIGDCIRAIANYVCITCNEGGKNLYTQKQVSKIVFGFFIKYLTTSEAPLNSYVMLKAFKDWLIERIEIIENCTNSDRYKIFNPKSFMMVSEEIKEDLIDQVMDSLFTTHQKFNVNQKVVRINFEVIILLGYIYSEWKFKVGKNFIPVVLDVLKQDRYEKETKEKALDVLNFLTGCDKRSNEPNRDFLDFAVEKGVIGIITENIKNDNFSEAGLEKSKNLLRYLSNTQANLESSLKLLAELIAKLSIFVQNGEIKDKDQIREALDINKQINSLCFIEPLKCFSFEKGLLQIQNKLLDKINQIDVYKCEPILRNIIFQMQSSCLKNLAQNVDYINRPKNKRNFFSNENSNIVKTAIEIAQKNQKDKQKLYLASEILNTVYPLHKNICKQIAQKLKFEPDLEQIYRENENSNNRKLAQEVTNLYMNFSETQKKKELENKIQREMNLFKQAVNKADVSKTSFQLQKLLPFSQSSVFYEQFQQQNILEYIYKTMKILNIKTKEKTNKSIKEVFKGCLGSIKIPDFDIQAKKKLEGERQCAKSLTKLLLQLPSDYKKQVKQHKKIVKLSYITGLLNGSTQTYDYYEYLLENSDNKEILQKNHALQLCSYLLLKNNQDSFQGAELDTNMRISTLNMTQNRETRMSLLSTSQIKQDQKERIQSNIEKYCKLMKNNLITQKNLVEVMNGYINALGSYRSKEPVSMINLMLYSRLIQSILMTEVEHISLEPYSKDL